MSEYRLDDVLQAIVSDNLPEMLANDKDILSAILTYCTSEADTLTSAIHKMESKEKETVMKGLLSIYPISTRVVESLVFSQNTLYPKDDIFSWLDVGDVMYHSIMQFRNKISRNQSQIQSEKSEYEKFFEQYKDESKRLEGQREKLRKSRQDMAEKCTELEMLKREVAELEAEWSEEAIKRQTDALVDRKRKLSAQKKDEEKRLKKLKEELDSIENSDKNFDAALKTLDDVMKKLPGDDSENE